MLSRQSRAIRCHRLGPRYRHDEICEGKKRILISPDPVRHSNVCVLSQNPTYIQYVFKYIKYIYMPEPGCPHLHVPQTFTFNMRPKSRVVVGTVRVWSLSGITFLWLASWAIAYRAFPTIAGDSVPQARTSLAA